MMNGIVLAVAMVVSSAGVSPAREAPRAMLEPPATFSFALPDPDASRPVWQRRTFRSAQSPKPKKFSRTERVIAAAAGTCLGWVLGGAIGYRLTENRSNPYDDMSGLTGAIIGATFGSFVGGILGWTLTDR